MKPRPLTAEFFLSRVEIDPANGCWIWQRALTTRGYGQMRRDRKSKMAHRASYEFFVGPIPNGLVACHTCDNRACINPKHIFLGTQKENLEDMVEKGRSLRGPVSHKAKLTLDQVISIKARFGKQSDLSIARAFGVGGETIRKIRLGETWKNV